MWSDHRAISRNIIGGEADAGEEALEGGVAVQVHGFPVDAASHFVNETG